jgi:hypothetical protein
VIEISNKRIQYFEPEDRPFGVSFGAWTTRWWHWALSIPISINPVLDETGKYAGINQQSKVWFLAGTIGDENKVAHRSCVIPKGKAILFPVINYIFTDEFLCSGIDLIKHVQKDIDDIVVREAIVNGYRIPTHRVKSEPLLFKLKVDEENKLGIPVGTTMASADGYWVFLKPLNDGKYDLHFHGACSGGLRNASAHYQIMIE